MNVLLDCITGEGPLRFPMPIYLVFTVLLALTGGSVDLPEMMEMFKKQTTNIDSKAKKENPDLIERGIFINKEIPEYCEAYNNIIQMAMKGRS